MSSYQPKIRQRAEKQSYTCHDCGKVLAPKEVCWYVDGCNSSITQNAPPLCHECYVARYGEDIQAPLPTRQELLDAAGMGA